MQERNKLALFFLLLTSGTHASEYTYIGVSKDKVNLYASHLSDIAMSIDVDKGFCYMYSGDSKSGINIVNKSYEDGMYLQPISCIGLVVPSTLPWKESWCVDGSLYVQEEHPVKILGVEYDDLIRINQYENCQDGSNIAKYYYSQSSGLIRFDYINDYGKLEVYLSEESSGVDLYQYKESFTEQWWKEKLSRN